MPRMYQGRTRSRAQSSRAQKPKIPGDKARSYVIKMLKQSGWAVAVLLLFYIIKYGNPGFYSYISPQVKSALEYTINITPLFDKVNNLFAKPEETPPPNTDGDITSGSDTHEEPAEQADTAPNSDAVQENADSSSTAENSENAANDINIPASSNADEDIITNM